MAWICPSCAQISTDTATRCECGRELDERNQYFSPPGFWLSMKRLFFGFNDVAVEPPRTVQKQPADLHVQLTVNAAGEVISVKQLTAAEVDEYREINLAGGSEFVDIDYGEEDYFEDGEPGLQEGSSWQEQQALERQRKADYPPEEMPFTSPVRPIIFTGMRFVFTGMFEKGSIESNRLIAEQLGAKTTAAVSRKTDYLVIGCKGCQNWTLSDYGSKIRQAKELADSGSPIQIVSELQWTE